MLALSGERLYQTFNFNAYNISASTGDIWQGGGSITQRTLFQETTEHRGHLNLYPDLATSMPSPLPSLGVASEIRT